MSYPVVVERLNQEALVGLQRTFMNLVSDVVKKYRSIGVTLNPNEPDDIIRVARQWHASERARLVSSSLEFEQFLEAKKLLDQQVELAVGDILSSQFKVTIGDEDTRATLILDEGELLSATLYMITSEELLVRNAIAVLAKTQPNLLNIKDKFIRLKINKK